MSTFDRLMERADTVLFKAFGDGAQYQEGLRPALTGLTIIVSHNVEVAGADGLFQIVQHLAEIRHSDVPKPTSGAIITVNCTRYRLDERLRTDGLVEYWSLLPER